MCATSIERFVYYFIGFLKCFVLTKKRFIWNKDHLLAFQININSFRNRQFQDRNHFHQPPPQWFLLGPLMLIGRLSPQTKGCRAPTCSLSTATGSDQALGKVDPPPWIKSLWPEIHELFYFGTCIVFNSIKFEAS